MNKVKITLLTAICIATAFAFLACEEKGKKAEAGTFTDARDGKVYKTVKIGEQVWMADNLAFDDDDSCDADCKKSDKLYDWESAMKACPKGWRLPSDAEWKTLVALAGSDNIIKGTDKYGFNAYGGGACFGDGGCSGGAFWWTSTEEGDYQAKYRSLNNSMIGDSEGKYCAFSVRCVQDGDGTSDGTASKAATPAADYSPALQTHYSKGTLGESGKTRPIEMFFQKVSKNGDSYSISGKSKTNAAEDAFSGTLSISSQTAGGSCNSEETELKGSYDFNEKESKTSGHFVGTFIACEKSGTLSKASFKGNWVKHANGNKTPCEFELLDYEERLKLEAEAEAAAQEAAEKAKCHAKSAPLQTAEATFLETNSGPEDLYISTFRLDNGEEIILLSDESLVENLKKGYKASITYKDRHVYDPTDGGSCGGYTALESVKILPN